MGRSDIYPLVTRITFLAVRGEGRDKKRRLSLDAPFLMQEEIEGGQDFLACSGQEG